MEPIYDIAGLKILPGTIVVDARGLSFRAVDTEKSFTDSAVFRAAPLQRNRNAHVYLKPECVAVLFDSDLAERRTKAAQQERLVYYRETWIKYQSKAKEDLFRQRQRERDADLRAKGYRR